MKASISTHLCRLKWWVVVSSLDESHKFLLVKLDIELNLHLVVLSRHFFVNKEYFMKKKMDILLLVLPLFMSHLARTLSQFLNTSLNNFEGLVTPMAQQDVLNCLCRVNTQQLAEVWIQWKVNLSLV